MSCAGRISYAGSVDERFVDVGGGISICYDEFGDPADPPLLLIMGLATQMIAWH